MKKNIKVVVAHPYKQHSFELAEGLRRHGLLYKYITTVYYKKYNLTWFISHFLKGTSKMKAYSRYDKRIDTYVIQYCEGEGLIKLLTMKIPSLTKYYEKVKYYSSDRFSIRVANFCLKNNVDVVIVYDDTSPLCSEIIKEKNPNIKVIMDMSAPALPYLSEIYRKDMMISPDYAYKLNEEVKKALDPQKIERSYREINSVDYFFAASEFTKKSLIECGIKEDSIKICRYGIDSIKFQPVRKENQGLLHAIYIGGTKQFKGISYLIDAFRNLSEYPVDLTVVGYNNLKEKDKLSNIKFTGVIMHDQVAEILKKCDFAIFPSLGDGFGFAVTEALSSGCPVICSKNAGASDLIKDYENGFIIDAQDKDAIVEKVKYFIDNRNELDKMKMIARQSVSELTWEKYYDETSSFIKEIITN